MVDLPSQPKAYRSGLPLLSWGMLIGAVVLGLLSLISIGLLAKSGFEAQAGLLPRSIMGVYPAVMGIAAAMAIAGGGFALRMLIKAQTSLLQVRLQQEELARRLVELRHQLEARPETGADAGPFGQDGGTNAPWQEILATLRDLRADSLLSEDERRKKHETLAAEELNRSIEQIRFLIEEGEFLRAESLAGSLVSRHPSDARLLAMPTQIDQARRAREATDIATANKEVNDLVSMSAWPQARQRAQALQEQHPDSVEARNLMLRIEREFRLSQQEQQRRMYAEVQRFVTRRRWSEAHAAAHTFIERFAGSDDAEALRLQLPTLEANAEIETRQHLESQIMDMVKHGRYIEATSLAKRVIDQYPGSPQADALRRQIDRLEELATDPGAPPARVRLE